MKKSLLLVSLAALSLSACGYSVVDAVKDIQGGEDSFSGGKAITSTAATTAAFTKVDASGPDNINFVTGDGFSIKAEGDADAIKKLRFKVEDGTIMIGREKGKLWGNDKGATITITAPTLAEASLAGSGDFKADKMAGEKVVLEIAGSGNLSVADIISKKLESNIAGSGDVVLAGKVDLAEYSVAGSGSIDATKLAATDADVSIAGSGNVSLTASGKVDADVAGSGDVNVSGGASCKSSTMGSGNITCS
jgi:Putative auto-transporter adhesin, head GIN domain